MLTVTQVALAQVTPLYSAAAVEAAVEAQVVVMPLLLLLRLTVVVMAPLVELVHLGQCSLLLFSKL